MKNYLYENHDVKGLVITEASASKLQEGVLAKVSGPSFFLDGYSRNGRFYPKKLWENALKNADTKEALSRGLMFGCIGHPKDYSLDELLESGRVSHKVTKIYIDEKTGEGMADYEILDTESGRILNTILRSGSDMYVSTRAFGGFSNETKSKNGKKYKVLDEKNFVIESIDFVIQPGFLETKPKLMEALQEDFLALQEKAIDHPIDCEDGICGLKFPSQNEVIDDMINKNEIPGESEVKGDNVNIDRDLLEELSKEDVITMLENVVNENNILIDKVDEETADDDMMVSAKLMMNYVSYVELLTKLVRYNVEYEKYYDQLIEFLDKDSKLTTSDMEELDKICDEILKEKDVEESITGTCERIKELASKMNDDGDDNEKEDKEGKNAEEREDDKPKGKDTEDDSTEVKAAGESFVDYVMTLMKPEIVIMEKITKVQDEDAIRELKGQLLQMKEATKFLTKKLDEEMTKAPKIEKVTETKIEYKVPEDIHETIIKEKKHAEELSEELESEVNKRISIEEKLDEAQREYKELEDKFNYISEDFNKLNDSIDEKEEKDKELFREILEDKKKEYDEVTGLYEELENKVEGYKKDKVKAVQLSSEYREAMLETKAKYYSNVYKVELPEVKKLMETYKNEKDLVANLQKEEKIIKRESASAVIPDIPEYKPSSRHSESKSKFLEGLTR